MSRGSDQNVYPPMSDFLREEQIPILTPFAADHIGADLDLVVVGNAISRGNPELETVLETKSAILLAARGDSRSVPLEIAADRHRRHARQDDDDGAHGLAADARESRSIGAGRRHCAQFGRRRFKLSGRAGARSS